MGLLKAIVNNNKLNFNIYREMYTHACIYTQALLWYLLGSATRETSKHSQSVEPTRRVNLPRAACIVSSPLRVAAWVEELRMFPDRVFVNFLIDGITVWFR